MEKIRRIRNIGISAHIDSGKTTLSERILYYTGRIHRMQEVHDDKGGATLDHVDFTVEVERSLRVLDGAIMVLCSVGGVQSQSFTVDQQIKRYRVPRIAFINKMDRIGADPERVCQELTEKLGLNVVPIQINMGVGDDFSGVIDLITMEAVTFEGKEGEKVVRGPIPAQYAESVGKARQEMLEALSMFNDEMLELLLEDLPVDQDMILQTIRETTINRDIVPVMMGAAFKNKGIQPLMDAVCDFLPSPLDRSSFARDHDNEGTEIPLAADPDAPLVAMVFKIADESFGQLSYLRVYQGRLTKGQKYRNARTNRVLRIGRIVRMHANDREDILDAGPGDIAAVLSIDCASGDTICGDGVNYSLESIFVADPVISLSIEPRSSADQERMAKALSRFMKEDPTFRVSSDPETGQTVIAGMGELHLDVYIERMRREFKAELTVGTPSVSYREAPTIESKFNYRHKKQTGGSGQYAHVIGRLIPLTQDDESTYEFEDNVTGGRIPSEYIPAVNKGFQAAMKKGPLAGYEIVACKMCLDDGTYHAVDSSEMAFRTAARDAFIEVFKKSRPCLQEPIMTVEVEMPAEFQGPIVGDLNSRRGIILETETRGNYTVMRAEVPLANMFGYATVVRGLSKGMASFTMEMSRYAQVPVRLAEEIICQRREKNQQTARK
ncbi:MAG: elongation factor G [Planctomycetota bacterium]|jgi:elongation factor G